MSNAPSGNANPWQNSPKATGTTELGMSYARAASPKRAEQPTSEDKAANKDSGLADEKDQDTDTHPPVLARMRPQPEARRKRKAKAQAARNAEGNPTSSEDEGPESSPCPPQGMANHSSKRKRMEKDVGIGETRRGTANVQGENPSHAPSQSTYDWMTRQATPGPSGTTRSKTPTYDLRRDAPRLGDQPSLGDPFELSAGTYANAQTPGFERPERGNGATTQTHQRTMPTYLHPTTSYSGRPLPLGPFDYAARGWTTNEPTILPPIPLRRQDQGGWQEMPIESERGWEERPDSRLTYAPMEVDAPTTPAPRGNAPRRPASALPFPFQRASELPRRATPFPRTASARPYPHYAPQMIRAPAPSYPHPSNARDQSDVHPPWANHGPVAAPPTHARATPYPTIARDTPLATWHRHPATPVPVQYGRPDGIAMPPPEPDMREPQLLALEDITEEEANGPAITPTPEGGWPEIQGDRPGWQYANMPGKMESSWRSRTFPHCLVATAGEGACDKGEAKRHTAQEDAILKVFGVKARVIQAHAATPTTRRNGDPTCNMLQVAYPADIQRILNEKCVSVQGGPTLFFFPAKPPPPTFMINVVRPEAFGANERDLNPVVRERMSRTTFRRRLIHIFQREMAKKNKTTPTAEERADAAIASVDIKLVTRTWHGEEIPLASIYCSVPSDEDETWFAVRDTFREARLGTDITGHPTPYADPMKCGTCHGVDHDTAMCKYPQLPDWNGPGGSRNRDDDEGDTEGRPQRDDRKRRGFRGRGRGAASGTGRGGAFNGGRGGGTFGTSRNNPSSRNDGRH